MKVHELQAILNGHDPTADVVISTKHNRACFHFRVEERVGPPSQEDNLLLPSR
jgi:hypothetical protein